MKKKFTFPRFVRSAYVIINIVFVAWLLLCKWVGFKNPVNNPTALSLLSFTAIFAYVGNVVFVFIWLFSKKKVRALWSAITIAICWNICQPLIGFNYFGKNNIMPSEVTGLKIMTWNVHLFDLGEWTKDKTAKVKILRLIADENPDVLCLEEFYWDEKNTSEPYTAILQQSGYPYVQFVSDNVTSKRMLTIHASKNDIIHIGQAIFSKFPLRNLQEYALSNKDRYKMLSTELVIDSSHIFTVNIVHLTSVGFGATELNYISEMKEKGIEAQNENQSKSLLKKLRNASAARAELANKIDSLKTLMDYPAIICGDFNDVPGSYVYNTVKGDLTDAFVKKGHGLGRTYRYISPTLRIDYMFYDDKALQIEGYDRPYVSLSDHYPVIANFSLKGND